MEFGILGPLQVRDRGRVITLPRRMHRALLAILLLRANTVVPTDVLLEELWGAESPRTAKQALQNYVSALRKALGNELVQTVDLGYVLATHTDTVDSLRFERLTAEAQHAATTEARAVKLREGLSLWRGRPLADLSYEAFAQFEIRRLEELELNAREDLIDAELSLGRHEPLVGDLEPLVAAHPYRERLRSQLMIALYRSGRHVDALEAYREARDALVELGLEPSEALRRLEQSILRQDAELAPADGRIAIDEQRKNVTVLVCEVVIPGSGLDPEHVRARAARATAEMRAAVEQHGGSVQMLAGEELLAVFGAPQRHEDDAIRAVRAADQARAAVDNSTFRIGIATGEVIAGRGFVSGEVVSLAKRLGRSAGDSDVLLSRTAVDACTGAVTVDKEGDGFRLIRVEPGREADQRDAEPLLVGRDRELTILQGAYEKVRDSGTRRLVAVVGEPGIGKSRLARELATSVAAEATVLVGRCSAYGEGAIFLPLREMLFQAGLSLDAVIGTARTVGEQLLAVRRALEKIARDRPLVLVFDDVHWAEPALGGFIEQLGAADEAAILTLCLLRPGRHQFPDAVELGPLPDVEVHRLLAGLDADERQAEAVLRSAGGNPLFAEQLLAYAREGGDADSLPPALANVITARLDLLEPRERAVLQRAAVVGTTFSRAAVEDLTPLGEPGAVNATLAALVGQNYLRRLRTGFRFHHVLVRDAAYASLPREERAALHERLADWLDDCGEPEEVVGYHLEQAATQLADLRHDERRARRLAVDAGRRLGAAGLAAWKRGDAAAAANLLNRATASLPSDEDRRTGLLCELGSALRTQGELVRAQATLEQAIALAGATGDRRVELRARLELEGLLVFKDPRRKADALLAAARDGIPIFESIDDHRSLGRAWLAVAIARGPIQNAFADCSAAATRALEQYELAGWPTASCVGVLSSALFNGPTPVGPAVERLRELGGHADLLGRAHVLARLAGLEAMRGEFGEAQTSMARSRRTFEDLGQATAGEIECGAIEAQIGLLAGNAAAAEHALRASCAVFERSANSAYLATRAAELADLLASQGQTKEAARWCRVAEESGASDDIPTQALLRCARGRLLGLAGDHDAAESVAVEAVRLTEPTDHLNQRARVLLVLAEVRLRGGRGSEALQPAAEAAALYERKGNVVDAERANTLYASLSGD
jgi:DNA-binding SARP family transcriptional activator